MTGEEPVVKLKLACIFFFFCLKMPTTNSGVSLFRQTLAAQMVAGNRYTGQAARLRMMQRFMFRWPRLRHRPRQSRAIYLTWMIILFKRSLCSGKYSSNSALVTHAWSSHLLMSKCVAPITCDLKKNRLNGETLESTFCSVTM